MQEKQKKKSKTDPKTKIFPTFSDQIISLIKKEIRVAS